VAESVESERAVSRRREELAIPKTKVDRPTKMRAAERRLKADEESRAKGLSSEVRRSK
jgi:hypothetical protein